MFKAESINFNRYDNDEVENTDKNQHNENKTVGCWITKWEFQKISEFKALKKLSNRI